MSRHGIPTLHKGRRHRSRLEARWAAFFDLVGWPYEYEPFDLGGWIPDFLLTGAHPVLVEVKPVSEIPWDVVVKIERARPEHEVLILGCTIPVSRLDSYDDSSFFRGSLFARFALGWLSGFHDGHDWGNAILGLFNPGNRLGFFHDMENDQPPFDRLSGIASFYDDSYQWLGLIESRFRMPWAEAGNQTQWHPA